jgi:hypothetical protein
MTSTSKVRPSRDHVVLPQTAKPAASYARRAALLSTTTVRVSFWAPCSVAQVAHASHSNAAARRPRASGETHIAVSTAESGLSSSRRASVSPSQRSSWSTSTKVRCVVPSADRAAHRSHHSGGCAESRAYVEPNASGLVASDASRSFLRSACSPARTCRTRRAPEFIDDMTELRASDIPFGKLPTDGGARPAWSRYLYLRSLWCLVRESSSTGSRWP